MSGFGETMRAGLARQAAAPGALGTLYVKALAAGLFCYATIGKGFAYLGVPPLHVGEVLFLAGLVAMLGSRSMAGTLAAAPNLVLLALGGVTLAQTLPYIPVHGVDAIRDSVVVLYGGFAFILCALLIERPERLHLVMGLFARFAAFYGATAWILYIGYSVLVSRGAMPAWPNSGLPLVAIRPGEVAVHLAGAAVFGLLFFRRTSWPWIGALLIGIGVIGAQSRGGLLAILLPLGAAVLVSGRTRELSAVMLFGTIAILLLLLLDVEVPITERDRPLSVSQVVMNFLSILQGTDEGDLDGTKLWRLMWWQAIVDYTFHGPYFWTGKGFGIALAEADGFGGTTGPDQGVLRSPHNVTMTILARAGVPGLALWLLLLASWFGLLLRNAILAQRLGLTDWRNLFLFLGCYLAAVVVNASFDVALEGPMLGIWFWVLFGIGCGASVIFGAMRAAGLACPLLPPARPAGRA